MTTMFTRFEMKTYSLYSRNGRRVRMATLVKDTETGEVFRFTEKLSEAEAIRQVEKRAARYAGLTMDQKAVLVYMDENDLGTVMFEGSYWLPEDFRLDAELATRFVVKTQVCRRDIVAN